MKAKITFVVEVEIELEPSLYRKDLYGRDIDPSTLTPERMLAIEIELAESDPVDYVNVDDSEWTITGELI